MRPRGDRLRGDGHQRQLRPGADGVPAPAPAAVLSATTNTGHTMASPETVLQFGAGRFLRGFVDRFLQNANDAGQNVGQVVVVQSTPGARAALLNQQPDGYHVLVRGYENG